jgi:hypothetical protein
MRAHSLRRIVFALLLALVFINASADAASLPSWLLTTPLPIARAAHGMAATATHVYAIGGFAGSCSAVSAVEFAPIFSDGNLGSWSDTTP